MRGGERIEEKRGRERRGDRVEKKRERDRWRRERGRERRGGRVDARHHLALLVLKVAALR
jgi:hypothetical protein